MLIIAVTEQGYFDAGDEILGRDGLLSCSYNPSPGIAGVSLICILNGRN